VIVVEGSIVVVGTAATVVSLEAVLIFADVEGVDADTDVAVSVGIGTELVLFTVNSEAAELVFATGGARLVEVRGPIGPAVLVLPVVNLVEVILLNRKV
jgi:hypothetical protein